MGGSGSTITQGMIPPELQGLYRSSAGSLSAEQKANPLTGYNDANPLQVAGPNQLQQQGAGLIAGGANPSGLDALTLQSILRMPGLAGAGPTTGQYDYGKEAGLGADAAFLNPQVGAGGEFGTPMRAPGDPGYGPGGQGQGVPGQNFGGVAPPPGQPGQSPNMQDAMPPPAGMGTGGFKPGGLMAPPAGYQSEYAKNQASQFGAGGAGGYLKDMGINFNSGPSAGTTFNKGGQSYTNVGASHEGAGPGGESKFLQDVGVKPGAYAANLGDKAYGGDLATADKAMASVAQQNLHDKVAGLTTADKVAMSKSGKDIFGNSAFGTDTSKTDAKKAVPGAAPVYGDTQAKPKQTAKPVTLSR